MSTSHRGLVLLFGLAACEGYALPVAGSAARARQPVCAAHLAHTAHGAGAPRPLLMTSAAEVPAPPTVRQWVARTVTSDAIVPTGMLVGIHAALRACLLRVGISFPASVVGMLGGFGVLCALRAASEPLSDRVEDFFAPACVLLRVWLAAILAPGFISLPLRMPAIAPLELAKYFAVIVSGLVITLAVNAGIATVLAPGECATTPDGDGCEITWADEDDVPAVPASSAVPSPFPPSQQLALCGGSAAIVGASLFGGAASPLLLNVGLLGLTLGVFSTASARCPLWLQVWVHPFLSCSFGAMLACAGAGALNGAGYMSVLTTYAEGAGTWLAMLMGPTVVSFSFQLYKFRVQLRERFGQIVGTALVGSMLGMVMAAAGSRAVGLAPVLRLALISRTTTTALAAEVGRLLSAEPALALLSAFGTGLFGIPLGKPLLTMMGVRDPPTRGLALSCSAHGGALLALGDEPAAFPFAVLMMSLGAASTVGLMSIAPVRNLVMAIALGAAPLP